jgi:Zn-dependent protease
MYQRGAVTLFHVKGVPVRAHWTLLLILPYLAVVFSAQFERVAHVAGIAPESLRGAPLLWGALLALALFASVAVHELAHTLVAMARGGRVRDITLMLLGGVSHFEHMPERPRTEALVSAAGPVTSLAIAGLLFVALWAVGYGSPDLRLGVFYIAYLNLLLGAFNLLPAFPMDGGRVLRAALAARLSRRRATDIAATVGVIVAVLLGIVGLIGGSFLLILIAVFVFFGARLEARGERVKEALAGLRVADLLGAQPPTVELDTRLDQVLPLMHRAGRLQLITVDEHALTAGIVRAADIVEIPPAARSRMTVRDLGDKLRVGLVTIPWNASARAALAKATESHVDSLVVVDTTKEEAAAPVGLLGLREIEEAVQLHLLESSAAQRRARSQPLHPA